MGMVKVLVVSPGPNVMVVGVTMNSGPELGVVKVVSARTLTWAALPRVGVTVDVPGPKARGGGVKNDPARELGVPSVAAKSTVTVPSVPPLRVTVIAAAALFSGALAVGEVNCTVQT